MQNFRPRKVWRAHIMFPLEIRKHKSREVAICKSHNGLVRDRARARTYVS